MICDDYIEAGYKVMSLYKLDKKGNCRCGNPDCEAKLKHPKASNWQLTPHWSEEQLDNMRKAGALSQFGVLVDGYLVIDIDPRNGGSLINEWEKHSRFVVETGGGGLHIYFRLSKKQALVTHLAEYPGVDFKSSGFVVGAGSMHASGCAYEIKRGTPHDADEPPPELLKLLEKKAHRTHYNGHTLDIDDSELNRILAHYPNDNLDYEDWIRCGMALHHATHGAGQQLWINWSSKSSKHDQSLMDKKWHSFGKSTALVTVGSLIYHAQKNGYELPHNFEPIEYENSTPQVDLLRPPGFVGKITDWINAQCRYPRERLAVAAALSAISNIGGTHKTCEKFGVTANQFIFCVAASATGKEAVLQAQLALHRAAGIAGSSYGSIKSEQEIVRNLMRDANSYYVIDEIGYLFQKIANAKNSGASYLEGVVGLLMSAYSKANSYLPLGGDLIDGAKAEIKKDLKKLEAKEDDCEDKKAKLIAKLQSLDQGIEHPFLSLIGYTTPITFDDLVTEEQATNGFFGRALIVRERESNPKLKKDYALGAPRDVPLSMSLALQQLKLGKKDIKTLDSAIDELSRISEELHSKAEREKERGLEAIVRRSFELILKVSFTLAIPEGVRTKEHVDWAYEYVMRDMEEKLNLASQNIAAKYKNRSEELQRRIMDICAIDEGETIGIIKNKVKKFSHEEIEKAVKHMLEQKVIKTKKGTRKIRYILN